MQRYNMQIATAQIVAPGEYVCGDHYVVIAAPILLVALADGLGHGPAAAEAARAFCCHAAAHASEPLASVFGGAGQALAQTRGAAAALLRCAQHRLSFAAVGNIELHALAATPMRPASSPGIVGRRVRRLHESEHVSTPGDLVVLHTDGISARFELAAYAHLPVQAIADAILADHWRGRDDATCVVVRL